MINSLALKTQKPDQNKITTRFRIPSYIKIKRHPRGYNEHPPLNVTRECSSSDEKSAFPMVKTIMINYTGNQRYVCAQRVCVCVCVEVEAARLVREDRWHPRCRGVARESTGNHPIRGQIHTGQHNFEVTRGTAVWCVRHWWREYDPSLLFRQICLSAL